MWSIFGTTDEKTLNAIGGLSRRSKAATYADGAWCGYCLKSGMRTWVDANKKDCPTCNNMVLKEDRIKDI